MRRQTLDPEHQDFKYDVRLNVWAEVREGVKVVLILQCQLVNFAVPSDRQRTEELGQ